ncbi:MAG: Hsp70 family protein [Myxococcota bacterium]
MTRFVLGIDLGTSNSALAYADVEASQREGRPKVQELMIPQLIGPGDVQERPLLPSARYEAAKFELPEGQNQLPWPLPPPAGDRARPIVGEAARKLGAKTPVRLVESAKSWLCHGGVNRTAAILPIHAPEGVPKISPVEASESYLAHLVSAWNDAMAVPATEADVIITVPASFDEMARGLTLEAARGAGLPKVTLIEEPLAAFYAFIARTGGTHAATGLSAGDRVLIADVGGGTSDFTLIDVVAVGEDGRLEFERTAVGDHLLLGGDNMDLALAHALEPELTKGKKLDAEGWAHLKLECRLAKEALFTELTRPSMPVTVIGRGSKLIGGSMRAELSRELLHQVVIDGYFPELPAGIAARPTEKRERVGLAEYGLPYASDPAITRHLAAFLLRHARPGEPMARVDAILFNGGALKPVVVRDRICSAIGDWMRKSGRPEAVDPRPLVYDQSSDALELAVARGAAYFGLVRAGAGLRVRGGAPRAYFVGLGSPSPGSEGKVSVLCVAPRGMQDGQELEVSSKEFMLVTNRPVEFPLYTSTGPENYAVGDVLTVDRAELHQLPPLRTVVKFGKQKAGTEVPVRIQAKRTELGTLELSCFSKMSGARFRLELDLRSEEPKAAASPGRISEPPPGGDPFRGAGTKAAPDQGEVDPAKLEAAKARIRSTFAPAPPRSDPEQLMKGLEADLGLGRDAFPLPAIRGLGELLLELMEARAPTVEHEARWLNLVGFCLRPGSGYPLDDWRVRQLWKIHAAGPVHAGRDPAELNWWILWRRVAAGLSRGHQEELSSILFPLLIPALEKRARRKPPRPKTQEAVEMWRAASSLELLSGKARAQLGDALVDAIVERRAPRSAYWCLGRIGARGLLYGPREATVRPSSVVTWCDRVLALPRSPKDEDPTDAVIAMARLVGDRQLDLEEEPRKAIHARLSAAGVEASRLNPLLEVVALDAAEQSAAFGEGLPSGLRLA